MSRHIIGALASVDERRRLWAKLVGCGLHVDANIRICVFIEGQRRRCMEDEYL